MVPEHRWFDARSGVKLPAPLARDTEFALSIAKLLMVCTTKLPEGSSAARRSKSPDFDSNGTTGLMMRLAVPVAPGWE